MRKNVKISRLSNIGHSIELKRSDKTKNAKRYVEYVGYSILCSTRNLNWIILISLQPLVIEVGLLHVYVLHTSTYLLR